MKQVLSVFKYGIIALIVLVVGFAGYNIYKFFNPDIKGPRSDYDPEQEMTIQANVSTINTNGNKTKEQITEQTSEENCPLKDDIYKELYFIEFDPYIVMYRKVTEDGNLIEPNIVFINTGDGTYVPDGIFGISGSYRSDIFSGGAHFDEVYLDFNIDFDNIYQRILGYGKLAQYTNFQGQFSSISRKYFTAKRSHSLLIYQECWESRNGNQITQKSIITNYMVTTFDKYFSVFDELEIINSLTDKDLSYRQKVGFYSSIINNVINKSSNQCVIDVTNEMVYPIPETERSQYPRTSSAIDQSTTYDVYKCNKYFICNYNTITSVFEDEDIDILPPDIPDVATTPATNKVTILLKNKLNSNLSGFNIANYPVNIRIFKNNILQKEISFDDTTDLLYGKIIGLANGKYTYEVDSDKLMLINNNEEVYYSGEFDISGNGTVSLDFKYTGGIIRATLKLQPNTNTSSVNIDLDTNPVTIVLSNNNNTYTFVFDNEDEISDDVFAQNKLVEIGTYDVSITSNQLHFSGLNQMTISAESYVHIIWYSSTNTERYIITESNRTAQGINDETYNIILNMFKGPIMSGGTYRSLFDSESLQIIVVDENDSIINNVTFGSFGSKLTNEYEKVYAKINGLTSGKTYNIQLKYDDITTDFIQINFTQNTVLYLDLTNE